MILFNAVNISIINYSDIIIDVINYELMRASKIGILSRFC